MKNVWIHRLLLACGLAGGMLLVPPAQAQSFTALAASATTAPAAARLRPGMPAPALTVTSLAGDAVTLDAYRGKPVVLHFGSVTEPMFRAKAAALEKLATRLAGKVEFLTVYTKEAHPANTPLALELNIRDEFNLPEPPTLSQRRARAQETAKRLNLQHQTLLVDSLPSVTATRYGGLPDMAFLIDATGQIAAVYPWMDPARLEHAIQDLQAGRLVAAEHQGPYASSQPPVLQAPHENRGPGAALAEIDGLQLSDAQKAAIYPALAQFLIEARDLREKTDGKTLTFEQVRTTAQTLKKTLQQQLTAADYRRVMDTLERGPARRLFD